MFIVRISRVFYLYYCAHFLKSTLCTVYDFISLWLWPSLQKKKKWFGRRIAVRYAFTWRPMSVMSFVYFIPFLSILMFWSVSLPKGCAMIATSHTNGIDTTTTVLSYKCQYFFFRSFILKIRCFTLMTIKSPAHLFLSRASNFSPSSNQRRQNKLLQLSVYFFFDSSLHIHIKIFQLRFCR